MTFADYATSSNAVIILAANKDKYANLDAICGASIGALKGTDAAATGEALAKDCANKSLGTLTVNYYNSVPDAAN